MKERDYSMNIANAVCDFLSEDDWHFSFDQERGIFKFGLQLTAIPVQTGKTAENYKGTEKSNDKTGKGKT